MASADTTREKLLQRHTHIIKRLLSLRARSASPHNASSRRVALLPKSFPYIERPGTHLKDHRKRESFAIYAFGILGESDRKSVEPIAALACGDPDLTKNMHDKLLHFVGAYAKVFDPSGHVAEWDNSCIDDSAESPCRVRGGSFQHHAQGTRCAMGRELEWPRSRKVEAVGFRCCAD